MENLKKFIMKNPNIKKYSFIWEIAAAAVIYGIGVSLFLDPNNLAPGGVTGIAIILNRLVGLQTGTWYFIINIPIILAGTIKFGVKFILKTFYAVGTCSFFTNIFAAFPPITDDVFIASLAGALLLAVGIGIIFRAGATTGGSDIIVKILRERYRHLKTGFIFMCFDIVVVSISAIIFRDFRIGLYALMTVVISGKCLDYVLYGSDEAKLMYIITEKPEIIQKRLLNDMEIGCTNIQGKGGWTDRNKTVIMCAVQKRMAPELEEIIKEEDPLAFMIQTSATEIYGEGYKDFFAEKL